MSLEPIRQKIDALDAQLVSLINERLALAAEIGKIKRKEGGQIYVAEREDAVLRKVVGQNQGPIKHEALKAIYREIMSAAIALEQPLLIAYLGPEATNTHAAAMKKFGASVNYHAMASIGDIFTGMMMAFAIIAAVRHAERTGKGQFVDIAMYDAMISLCERMVYLFDIEGRIAEPVGNGHPLLAPFGIFRAADGWVSIGVVDDSFWRALVDIIAKPELKADSRFATKDGRRHHAAEVNAIVTAWTSTRSKAELSVLLGGKLPYGPVNDVGDIMANPHVEIGRAHV